jgi:tRNA dimethylallyltransferase
VSTGPRTLVAIVGATATGKSDLGEQVARAIGGEVVCADARQVFRELETGTGKPAPSERAALPHHLFDALALEDRPTAGWYARAAREACESVFARGGTPVLVGGSGLYLRALLEGLHPEPPADPAARARVRAELEAAGPEALHSRLARVDPETAARLAPQDRQRVSRALEVFEASGRPLSWWHANAEREPFAVEARLVEVVCEPAELSARIETRTRSMFEGGLLEETRALAEAGRERALEALKAIGYDEALGLLRGRHSRAEAEERTNRRTRQLAKRQRTWFRHQVSAVPLPACEKWEGPALAAAFAALRLTPRRALP